MNQFKNSGTLAKAVRLEENQAIVNSMEKKLAELKGKRIEVNCGNGVAFAGENLGLEDGVLGLECEGAKRLFIDASKIVVISEASDTGGKPGFIV